MVNLKRETGLNVVGIIPARMGSTRFPGKPLAKISGLPMIEHVRRRASLCRDLSGVIVATCDKEIEAAVKGYGGDVIMTADIYERCTDRIAEAAARLEADIIVNIQGDEPLVTPKIITEVVKPMIENRKEMCVNLICRIDSDEEFSSPNAVKVVVDLKGYAAYFSREPIPSPKMAKGRPFDRYKQLGIMAFTKRALALFTSLEQTPLEKVESVDMLRFIENGYPIKTVIIKESIYGVDTPEDLARAQALMKSDDLAKEYI